MNLKQWIKEHHITQAEFAEMIGYDSTHLSSCMNGNRPITRRFEVVIAHQTKDAVQGADDILNIEEHQARYEKAAEEMHDRIQVEYEVGGPNYKSTKEPI